jgi:hypothetical protein
MEFDRRFGALWGSLFGLGCMGVFLLLYIGSLIWVFTDSQSRGKTGCIWLLLVLFTWPVGLIAYFVVRDQEVRL